MLGCGVLRGCAVPCHAVPNSVGLCHAAWLRRAVPRCAGQCWAVPCRLCGLCRATPSHAVPNSVGLRRAVLSHAMPDSVGLCRATLCLAVGLRRVMPCCAVPCQAVQVLLAAWFPPLPPRFHFNQ